MPPYRHTPRQRTKQAKKYIVKKGDTWPSIAEKLFGNYYPTEPKRAQQHAPQLAKTNKQISKLHGGIAINVPTIVPAEPGPPAPPPTTTPAPASPMPLPTQTPQPPAPVPYELRGQALNQFNAQQQAAAQPPTSLVLPPGYVTGQSAFQNLQKNLAIVQGGGQLPKFPTVFPGQVGPSTSAQPPENVTQAPAFVSPPASQVYELRGANLNLYNAQRPSVGTFNGINSLPAPAGYIGGSDMTRVPLEYYAERNVYPLVIYQADILQYGFTDQELQAAGYQKGAYGNWFKLPSTGEYQPEQGGGGGGRGGGSGYRRGGGGRGGYTPAPMPGRRVGNTGRDLYTVSLGLINWRI